MFLAGEDYNYTAISLSFSGDEILVINVTILNNTEVETDNETFTMQLVLNDPPVNLLAGVLDVTVLITGQGIIHKTAIA